MTIFFEQYVDQRAMKYSLLRTPYIPVAYLTLYLIAVFAGKKLMANRKPYSLRTFAAVYNIGLLAFCIYIIRLAFLGGFRYDYLWRCYGIDYTSQDEKDLTMLSMCYFTFIAKGLELIETVVFVLRKKNNQVSFFHVYHHVSTFIFAWIFARTYNGGMQTFPLVINSMAHVIMYSYYFLSSLGPTVQQKFSSIKKYVTSVQITQICLILANALAQLKCDNLYTSIHWFFIPNIVLILYLFLDFFRKNYLSTSNNRKAK